MTPRVCSIDGCDRLHHARGWCHRHYTNWYNTADATSRAIPPQPRPVIARIPLADVAPDKRAAAWASQVRFDRVEKERR